MTELNNLKQALENVVADEFKNASNELSFTPSEQFNKKMEKLIKHANKPYYKYTSTGVRRAICVIAAVLVLMLSTLTVSAVRESVNHFFVRVFSSQNENTKNKVNKPKDNTKPISTKNNSQDKTKKQTIQTLYELGYIPDGFELASFDNTGYEAKTEYFKGEDKITLTQYAKGSYIKTIDEETTYKDIEYIDNQKYRIYTCSYSSEITVVWNNGEYIFSVYSTLPKDIVISLCKSIKIKESSKFEDTIKKVYALDEMPDGFELVDYSIDENRVLYVYSFGEKTLTFTQNVKFSYNSAQDVNAEKSTELYNNKAYTIYTWANGEINVEWDNKEYVFSIQSTLEKQEIISLCELVAVVGERKSRQTIKTVYELDEISEEFKLTDFKKEKTEITTKYSSTTDYIRFKQYANSAYSFGSDIENTSKTLKVIDNKKYIIYSLLDSNDVILSFENDGYVFLIRSSLTEKEVIKLSESIKIKEPKKQQVAEKTTKKNNKEKETSTTKETINKIYELGVLPDGYSLIDYALEASNVSYVYSFDDKMLTFSQNLSSSYSNSIDKQSATESVEIHNGHEYTIYTFENGDINIIWNNGEFIFDLFGNLDKQQAIDMCTSIKIKEN